MIMNEITIRTSTATKLGTPDTWALDWTAGNPGLKPSLTSDSLFHRSMVRICPEVSLRK